MVLLALSVACQRVDLPDNQPIDLPTGAIGSKATITFSTADLTGPETRGILNAEVEVETLHLIVFDENGMLVEVCEAKEHGSSDHGGHTGGKHYSVTLTVTEEPRIIHYVANCPVNQVVYGHETSIIGNMFVDRNDSEGAETEYEVSYWARIEVPYILVEEIEEEQADGTKKKVLSLVDDIKDKFMHVPLLRNYAEITVTQNENDNTFEVLGFTVYNLLNRGTVAPYNSNTQQFQSFFEYNNGEITKYLYPEMYKEFHYEGHALTSAKLITDLVTVKGENGEDKVKEFKLGEHFYVYERKVSVMTDEEEKWRESPPHIIIKARYNHGQPVDPINSPIYYYKMDLVYTDKDEHGTEEVKYYNILRNFMYDFNITAIHDVGYDSWEKAAAGAAGNNISGSSSTSKLTNVSDNEGRLWVSYTDITLVSDGQVTFRYKYMPNYYDSQQSNYQQVNNNLVKFENTDNGEVITNFAVAATDITSGEYAGWREVTISVNAPDDIIRQQIVLLKTNNANLNRQIRFTLRKKLTMEVECTPKVSGSIKQPVTVDIKLPLGMTEDMFPLKLDMETYDRTLSPDATKNSIPVTAGTSIIDVEGRRGELSYYYTVTIPTLEAYKELPNDGNMKVCHTYWLTNKADNASTFYVANRYFNQASDSWENYKYVFSNASCSSSALGVGKNVTISFTMADGAINKPVTISLVGMTYTGTLGGVNYTDATEVKYTPSSKNVSISGFKTTTDADPVSFTLDADEYNIEGPVEGARETYKFNGEFVGVTSLKSEADVEVDFTFNISADALNALKSLYPDAGDAGVPMFVTLDRMYPADDQLVYSQAKATGDRYIYRIKQAGAQIIRLATIEDIGGPCTVTLQADYFDTETVTIYQKQMEFRSLSIPNQVIEGAGRAVEITFQLAEGDSNRDVTVVLENMAIGGETTLSFNTGNSDIVTNNNGTYTINNVVTTGADNATLKVKISALGYADKEAICSNRLSAEVTGTISFAYANQRISRDNNKQVWKNGDITLTNEKSSGSNVTNNTNPVRFLEKQSLKIEAPGEITKIVFEVDNNSNQYPTRLKNSITDSSVTVTVSGYTVTVTMSGTNKTFEIASLAGNIQLDSISVTYKQ